MILKNAVKVHQYIFEVKLLSCKLWPWQLSTWNDGCCKNAQTHFIFLSVDRNLRTFISRWKRSATKIGDQKLLGFFHFLANVTSTEIIRLFLCLSLSKGALNEDEVGQETIFSVKFCYMLKFDLSNQSRDHLWALWLAKLQLREKFYARIFYRIGSR